MEPLVLYGNNPKRMLYSKFGYLSFAEREQRKQILHTKIEHMSECLLYKMKRHEVETHGYNREQWSFTPNILQIVDTVIYHIGIIPIESITIYDILEIAKMEPAPYRILSWI